MNKKEFDTELSDIVKSVLDNFDNMANYPDWRDTLHENVDSCQCVIYHSQAYDIVAYTQQYERTMYASGECSFNQCTSYDENLSSDERNTQLAYWILYNAAYTKITEEMLGEKI